VILGIFWSTLFVVFCRTLNIQGEILSIFGRIEAFGASRSFLLLQGIIFSLPNLVSHRSKVYKDPKSSKKERKKRTQFSVVIGLIKAGPWSLVSSSPLGRLVCCVLVSFHYFLASSNRLILQTHISIRKSILQRTQSFMHSSTKANFNFLCMLA
jgi:hypothetical protein